MARKPYLIARQEHLGDMLDVLARLGGLSWKWEYDDANRRAIYWIALGNGPRKHFDTKRAEELVQSLCDERGIIWVPVAHPGGEEQRTKALAKMAALKSSLPR